MNSNLREGTKEKRHLYTHSGYALRKLHVLPVPLFPRYIPVLFYRFEKAFLTLSPLVAPSLSFSLAHFFFSQSCVCAWVLSPDIFFSHSEIRRVYLAEITLLLSS